MILAAMRHNGLTIVTGPVVIQDERAMCGSVAVDPADSPLMVCDTWLELEACHQLGFAVVIDSKTIATIMETLQDPPWK